ncbi:hypothetical protein Zmor_007618 [Zophobas morio]|uniref:7tm 6 domain containing protein n=1 Tax=Zophobas morio TaxID=2755281 RepID=A0AA38J019_9CUCU|nr:hypothetical protein Zmor_007618 [Zophobas morio]
MCTNKKFDWTRTIKTNILLLRLVGLWPSGNENFAVNFYTVYAFISVIVIMGGNNFFQIMNIFFVYTDLEALASTIFITITNVQASVKMYFFIRNIGLVKKLIQLLNGPIFQPKSKQQINIVKPTLKLWKTVYVCFVAIVAVTTFIWSIVPLLNDFQSRQLPLAAWYPYNHTVSIFYELTYMYQTIGLWYLAVANVDMDTLIVALMMYVVAQCDILCSDLKNLTNKKFGSVNKQITDCVKHHKEILSFARDSNKFFEMIILGQFFTSTIVLASTMFQLTLVNPLSSEGLVRIMYASGVITQIFIYCWFGNEVEAKVRYPNIFFSLTRACKN